MIIRVQKKNAKRKNAEVIVIKSETRAKNN